MTAFCESEHLYFQKTTDFIIMNGQKDCLSCNYMLTTHYNR